MKRPAWFERFWQDLKRREFRALKAIYFLIFGGMFTLYPFLTIHARSLGITKEEIGAVYGVLPILGIFAPALAGMIADKIGNFKIMMSVTFTASGLSALVFLLVPKARLINNIPNEIPLTVACFENNSNLTLVEPFQCNYTFHKNISVRVNRCKFRCPLEKPIQIRNLNSEFSENQSVPAFWNKNTEDGSILSINEEFCSDFGKLEKSIYEFANATQTYQENCWLECLATTDRSHFCHNNVSVIKINPPLTIGLYLLVRILNGITLAMSIPLLEGATVAILKEHKGDFGFQRIYINLGMIVMTPISGLLMDTFSSPEFTDYRPAFFLYCGMNILSSFAILFIDLQFKKPASNVVRDFRILLKKLEVTAFLLINLINGINIGVIDTFLFWLLEDLGADKSLMGITVMVGACFGIPMLLGSAPLIQKLGHVNAICLGMAFYIVRLMGYSMMMDPWWAMPFEALESFTVSLLGVVSVSYAAILSTSSTVASLQGLQAGMVHGVGRGAGSLLGGYLSTVIGIRKAFQIMAGVSGVSVLLYFLSNYLVFEKRKSANESPETPLSSTVHKDISYKTEKSEQNAT